MNDLGGGVHQQRDEAERPNSPRYFAEPGKPDVRIVVLHKNSLSTPRQKQTTTISAFCTVKAVLLPQVRYAEVNGPSSVAVRGQSLTHSRLLPLALGSVGRPLAKDPADFYVRIVFRGSALGSNEMAKRMRALASNLRDSGQASGRYTIRSCGT